MPRIALFLAVFLPSAVRCSPAEPTRPRSRHPLVRHRGLHPARQRRRRPAASPTTSRGGRPGHVQGRRREGPARWRSAAQDDVIDALEEARDRLSLELHSVHPTPAEYLREPAGTRASRSSTAARGPGRTRTRRIFGVERRAATASPAPPGVPRPSPPCPRCGSDPGRRAATSTRART